MLLLLLLPCAFAAEPPANSTPAQTARQALIEMIFSKTPGSFAKHLPVVTVSTLEKSGALAQLQQYSALAGQVQAQGAAFETFDSGPLLLSVNDPKSEKKFEITVENDSLQGDEDDIEVSFQGYKNNQLEPAAALYLPRVTFAMKMELGVWKLNEILVTLRLPLADPAFLNGITE